jgi:hypothetical protein
MIDVYTKNERFERNWTLYRSAATSPYAQVCIHLYYLDYLISYYHYL